MSDINIEDHIETDEVVEKEEIEHNGDILKFEFKELSGAEKDKILNQNLTLGEDSEIDLHQYKIDYLQEKIVNTNVPKLEIFLQKCKDKIYSTLTEKYVDYPESTELGDEEGN
jgi:hypothetical protein